MTINYVINSEVIDIMSDTPNADDIFLVDSNIWYWLTYTRASLSDPPPKYYQINEYPKYINKVLLSKGKLVRCSLCLSELIHRIESTEYQIFERTNINTKIKEFRYNYQIERQNVIQEIKASWAQVKSMSKPISFKIDQKVENKAMTRLDSQFIDGYDFFILEAIGQTKIRKIITDDGDYTSVPGIQVFTANRNVISCASTQGKLITRGSTKSISIYKKVSNIFR